nr:hypothetical protein [Tanacetum cinerariifolium]
MTAVSCGFLLYAVQIVGRPPILLVVPVFLLVVLVRADGWVSAGRCTIPTGSCTISTGHCTIPIGSCTIPIGSCTIPTGSCTIPIGSCTLPTCGYLFMLLDWFLLVVMLFLLDDHNKIAYLEKGKGWEAYEQILDFLNRSYIRYAFTHRPPILFDSLVKQLWATATVRTLEAGPSEITATIEGNEDGPHMPLLAPMLVVLAGGDGADAVAAGAAAAHAVPPPPPPPIVPLTHSSLYSKTLHCCTSHTCKGAHTKEVGPTSSTRPPSPTRQTSFQEDISEGGGDFISSPKSNEALQTLAVTAVGGAEDFAALTNLSLKLDRCITRVTMLENELGVTKKVLGGAVLKLVTRVKRLEGLLQQRKRRLVLFDSEGEEAATKEQDIDLDALHNMASMSLGGDSTVEAAYTIYKASQDAHASSDAGHDAAEVPDDTTMPFRRISTMRRRLKKPFTSSAFEHFLENISAVKDTLPASEGIPTAAPTIPASSTTIPAEFARQQEELAQKAQDESVASLAEQGTGLSDQRRRELDAAQLIYTEADWLELMAKIATNSALSKQLLGDDVYEENMNERLGMLLMTKRQSAAVYNQGWTMKQVKALSLAQLKHAFEYIQRTLERSNLLSFKRTTFRPTPLLEAPSAKRARQEVPQDVHTASSQVPARVSATPSTVVAVLVSTAPSVPADTEGYFHVLFQSLDDEDAYDFWRNQDSWRIHSWRLYLRAQVYVLETMDGQVIYMFVDVSYPLSAATLQRMLKHGLEFPKLLVGGDLTMAEQLVSFIKAALLNAQSAVTQNWMVITFHVPFWNDKWLVQGSTALELASPEQTTTCKDVSNLFMAVVVCQKPLGYFSSPMIHVPRAGLGINNNPSKSKMSSRSIIWGRERGNHMKDLCPSAQSANTITMARVLRSATSAARSSGNANVANAQRDGKETPKRNGCFECGASGHFKKDCPKLKNKNGGNRNAQGWVYAVGNAERNRNAPMNPDSNVIM